MISLCYQSMKRARMRLTSILSVTRALNIGLCLCCLQAWTLATKGNRGLSYTGRKTSGRTLTCPVLSLIATPGPIIRTSREVTLTNSPGGTMWLECAGLGDSSLKIGVWSEMAWKRGRQEQHAGHVHHTPFMCQALWHTLETQAWIGQAPCLVDGHSPTWGDKTHAHNHNSITACKEPRKRARERTWGVEGGRPFNSGHREMSRTKITPWSEAW